MNPPFEVSDVIVYGGEFIVEIYVDGAFWDHRAFATREAADAFRADPLADDRARCDRERKREEKRDNETRAYYAADYVKVSRGRRVGRKPGAA